MKAPQQKGMEVDPDGRPGGYGNTEAHAAHHFPRAFALSFLGSGSPQGGFRGEDGELEEVVGGKGNS